jgi:DNA-binding response OmpR family regulator
MADRILVVEEAPSASRSLLEKHGYDVTSVLPDEAVVRAHDVTPDLMLFIGSRGVPVARTLGAMHDVPMVFVGAKRAEVRDLKRRQVVAPDQPLLNAIRGALVK